MADGSIKFDVKLETDEFKKNLKDMANFSGEALKTLDDAIAGGALSGISSMEAVADSSFANLMKFSEEEKNYLISLSKSAAKTEQERQNEIYKIRRQAAANDLRKMTDEDRIRNEMRERELQQIKNSLDAGVISQQEYYVKLREFRDKYFDVGSKEWEEYTLDILKYCKNMSEELARIQKAFVDYGAVQCGFCSPGMIMSTVALLQKNPKPTEEEIRRGLSGNICRCTGYQAMVDAIQSLA